MKVLHHAFEDVAVEYEDMEEAQADDERLLATVAFIAGPDDRDFIEIPGRHSTVKITAMRKPQ